MYIDKYELYTNKQEFNIYQYFYQEYKAYRERLIEKKVKSKTIDILKGSFFFSID